jgi:nitroreductase
MLDVHQVIEMRKSVRAYDPRPVPEDTLRRVLEAGRLAPSASNRQPWHFVVIDDRKVLDEIPKFHTGSSALKEANHAIVVCGEEQTERRGRWAIDCAAATENILIAANAMGLGAVWMGAYPMEERVSGIKKC